jgi:predicted Zn-dependent protease
MRRFSAEANEARRVKVRDELAYADSALDNDDLRRATDIWNKLIADCPEDTYKSPLALKILLRLRRFDEAIRIMGDGLRRSPGNSHYLQGLVQIAQAKGDHKEAMVLSAQMRKRFPGVIGGYTLGAESLRVENQLAEAEGLAQKAMKLFPEEMAGFLEYARIPAQRQDWEEALRRWQPIREQFGYFGGYVGSAQALVRLGRYDEAEELLERSRYRFSSQPEPFVELARVAEAKGDIPEAVERWKVVLHRFPLDMHVYLAASEAFERLGEITEAEVTLRAAIDRFPTEQRPLAELAKLLQIRRKDFAAAAEAWAALRKAFPNNEAAYTNGADTLRHAGQPKEADVLLAEHRLRFNAPRPT